MNVASETVRMLDKVGLVPGLSIAFKLAMLMWQIVQVYHVMSCGWLTADFIRAG